MSTKDPPIAVVPMANSQGEKSTPEPFALEQSVSPETEHPHGHHHHHHHLTRVNSDAHSETHSTHSGNRKHRPLLLYWASITPLLCGALGPVLTLLALSGCADRWRMYVAPDGSNLFEKDPRWVIGVTALAIIVGLFANILLLLRMLGRGNPKHLQIFAILLWFLECMSLPSHSPIAFLHEFLFILLSRRLCISFGGGVDLSDHEFHDNRVICRDCR